MTGEESKPSAWKGLKDIGVGWWRWSIRPGKVHKIIGFGIPAFLAGVLIIGAMADPRA